MFVSFLIAVSALGGIMQPSLPEHAQLMPSDGTFHCSLFSLLGHWQEKANSPVDALLLQGTITAILVLLGTVYFYRFL